MNSHHPSSGYAESAYPTFGASAEALESYCVIAFNANENNQENLPKQTTPWMHL